MGLLDALFNGGISLDDGGPTQSTMLEDLLRQMDNLKGNPKIPVGEAIPQNVKPVQVAALQPDVQAAAQPQQSPATEMPPLQQVNVSDRQLPGHAYTQPETPLPSDDAARRAAAAAKLNPAMAQPASAPRQSDTGGEQSFAERLSAFGHGYAKGGLVGAIGDAMGGGTDSTTVRALMKNLNVDRDTATAMTRTPALAQVLFGNKTAPQIIDLPGAYGQTTKVYFDPQTRTLKPASELMDPRLQSGTGPAALPSAPAPAPVLGAQAPAAPQGGSAAQAPVAPPQLNLQPPQAQPQGQSQAPAPAAQAPVAPGQITAANPGQYRLGTAVPKPPDGFIHKPADDGSGFLYTQDGRPVFESKAEADARAKGTEKRALEQVDAQNQISGIKGIIDDARKITQSPGFDSALTYGRASLNIGLPTPLGMIGGDVATPVKQVARMMDSQNPAYSTADEIAAVQNRLNLLVARPLMKGQGQVSDSERKTISEAIGGLSQAQNAADFNFRLNSVQRMIEDMNANGKLRSADSYSARPTQEEIRGAIDEAGKYGPQFRQGAVDALAAKYNVRPADMQAYLNQLYMRGH